MVRIATQADRLTVEEIVQAAYQPWVRVIGMRPLPMEADHGALIEAGYVWVVDPLNALIVLVPEDGALLVDNVAVRPSAQGTGLGRRLLAFAEDRACELGLPAVRLYTNKKMTANIVLYRSLGYQETQEEPIEGRHVVHMRKPLTTRSNGRPA